MRAVERNDAEQLQIWILCSSSVFRVQFETFNKQLIEVKKVLKIETKY